MSKTIREIPATELIERAGIIARVASDNDESRTWGALNDVYLQELPAAADWTFLLASSSLTTTPKYATGTVSVNTGDTALTFTGATLPTALDGGRIKFNDNPNVYTFTRTGAGTGTISPALSEDRNISGGAYVLYQPLYTLPENFNRFPKNGGLQLWQGGKPTPIPEEALQSHYTDFSASPQRPTYCRLVEPTTAGTPRVELVPPPDKAYLMPYDYFFHPVPLRETTGGTATVVAGGTGATFSGGTRLAEASSGWYFRIDAFGTDAASEWYRVLSVNAATSAVTFTGAFGGSGATAASYTLCNAPVFPILLQGGLLHGTVKRLLADQNDSTFVYVDSMQGVAVSDTKRLYRTRIYNQHIDSVQEEYHFRR